MAQPSSFATLIVASLLSYRPRSRLGSDGCVAGGRVAIDDMLRIASLALAVTFTVASNLPLSSPSLASELEFLELIGSHASQDASPSTELNESYHMDDDESSLNSNASDNAVCALLEEGLTATAVGEAEVGDNASRANEYSYANGQEPPRSSMVRKSVSSLNLLRQARRTSLEYDAVPEMKACDSMASLSSLGDCSSASARSSSDLLSFAPRKKSRKHTWTQHSAEWTIFE